MTRVRPVVGVIDPGRPCDPAHVGLHRMTSPDRLVLPLPTPAKFTDYPDGLALSPWHDIPTLTYVPVRSGVGWLTLTHWRIAGLGRLPHSFVEDDVSVPVEWRWLEAVA